MVLMEAKQDLLAPMPAGAAVLRRRVVMPA